MSTLFEEAQGDLMTFVTLLRMTDDEFTVQAASYLLHQAVEKLLKHLYFIEGFRCVRTRDIDVLLDNMDFHYKYFDDKSFERLREKAALLMEWENRVSCDESRMINPSSVKSNIDFVISIFEQMDLKLNTQSSSVKTLFTVGATGNRYYDSALSPMNF